MELTGILLGLAAALGHSLSYLATRWFTQDRGRGTGQLLVLSHTAMGLGCAAVLPWVWPAGLGWEARWLLRLAGVVGCFVVAQVCLLSALRRVEASRVAPLLGLKVAMLAVISVALGGSLSAGQWLGVGLAVVSAWMLHGVGGRLPPRVTALVFGACVAYAVNDTFILSLIREVQRLTGDRSVMGVPLFAAAAAYTAVGGLAACLLPVYGTRQAAAWRDAAPYTASWALTMVVLYAAFAAIETVLTSILQSTRGLISIGLGVLLARAGWQHLEPKQGGWVVGRRLAAAALMTAAVACYVVAGRGSG